jgi:hypothetical protein
MEFLQFYRVVKASTEVNLFIYFGHVNYCFFIGQAISMTENISQIQNWCIGHFKTKI